MLAINNKALFDVSDWEGNRKGVVFFVNEISSVISDDASMSPSEPITRNLNKIKLTGDDFEFEATNKGKFYFDKKIIKIYIE